MKKPSPAQPAKPAPRILLERSLADVRGGAWTVLEPTNKTATDDWEAPALS